MTSRDAGLSISTLKQLSIMFDKVNTNFNFLYEILAH